MELTGTHLRYLLRMYQMSQIREEMRLTEIANTLHVKKASAARMIHVFREKGLVEQHLYGKIYLTERGKQYAKHYNAEVRWISESLIENDLVLDLQQTMDAVCMLLPELPEGCIKTIE